VHTGRGQRLDGVVVQVPGQAAPLLLLGGDQLAEQVAPLALHPLQVGHVHGHADHAGDAAVGVEQGPVVDVEDDVAHRPLGPQLLAGQQPLEVGRRLRLVAAQLHERPPDPLRGADAEPLEGPALGEAADAVGVVGRKHDRGAGDHRPQPGLAGPQLAGGPVALGEVLHLAEEALGAAVGAVHQGRGDEQVQAGAVGSRAAALDLEAGLAALGRGRPAQVPQHRVVAGLGQGHPGGRLVEAEAEVQSAPPSLSPAGEQAHVLGQPRPAVSDE
jgi:hypothetical protein